MEPRSISEYKGWLTQNNAMELFIPNLDPLTTTQLHMWKSDPVSILLMMQRDQGQQRKVEPKEENFSAIDCEENNHN